MRMLRFALSRRGSAVGKFYAYGAEYEAFQPAHFYFPPRLFGKDFSSEADISGKLVQSIQVVPYS